MWGRGNEVTGTTYTAHPPRGGGKVAHQGLDMDVDHFPGETAYVYGHVSPTEAPEPSQKFQAWHDTASMVKSTHGWNPSVAQVLMDQGSSEIARHERRGPDAHISDYSGDSRHVPAAEQDLLRGGPDGQLKLFGVHERPQQHVVSSLFSTKEARVHAPAMLAAAEMDTRQRFGTGLTASDDRSDFSEQLTQRLGALTGKEMTPRVHTNPSQFVQDSNLTISRNDMEGENFGPQVATGRRNVRSMLRNARGPRQQGEQMQIPMQTATPPETAGRARRKGD